MKRNLAIGFLASLSLIMGASACKKEEKKEASQDKTAEGTGDKKEGAEGAARPATEGGGSAAGADVLAHFPADTEVVATLSIANLRSAPMWAQYSAQMMAAAAKEMGEFKDACGFDPIATIESVHVGFNTSKDEEPVVIVKGFQRAQVSACIAAMAKKEGKDIKSTDEGAFTTMNSDGKETTLAWINDTTVLFVPKKADKEFLQARIDGKDSVKGKEAFMALASAANQSASIWFAGLPAEGSPMHKGLGSNPMGVVPAGVYGSMDFKAGLALDVGVRFASADEATATKDKVAPMLQQVKPMLGPAGSMIDKLQLAAAGNDMTVKLNLSNEDLTQMQQMLGPMLGGM